MRPFSGSPLSILLTVPLLTGCGAPPQDVVADLAIRGVSVLSPEDGSVAANQTVLIAGDRIVAIGPVEGVTVPARAQVVEGQSGYLVPGLWDLHTHLSFADENAGPLMVSQGVTGARDMGAVLADIEAIRGRFDRREVLGPRVVRAGPALNGAEYGSHQRLITTPDDARAAVEELDSIGVDVLKTHNATSRESYFALLEAARASQLPVVGHIPLSVAPLEACESGQRSIDHIVTIFEGVFMQGYRSEVEAFLAMDGWLTTDAHDLAACFAAQDVLFVPTLYTYYFRANRGALWDVPPEGMEYLTAGSRETYRNDMEPSERDRNAQVIELRSALVDVGQAFTKLVYDAGGAIGTGTDFAGPGVVPGFSVHEEVALLVAAGLPAHAAIHAATRGPGSDAGAHPLTGRIEVGAPADLLLVSENPFNDISALRDLGGVIARGRWLDRAALDDVLLELATN